MKDTYPFPSASEPDETSDSEDTLKLPELLRLGQLPPALVRRAEAKYGKRPAQSQENRLRNNGAAPSPQDQPGSRPRRNKRKLLLITGCVIGLLAMLAGGISFTLWQKANTPPPEVMLYKVGTPQTVPLPIGGGGITYPKQQITISYPAAERIVSMMVKAGDHVKANQSLVQLDPSQINVAIQQAESDVAAALAYLNTVAVAGTATNIAAAQQAYDVARNKYNALVSQASSPLYHNGTLVAPMNGVITTVNVDTGAIVPANSTILTVTDESTEFVHIKVPLSNLGQIQRGQKAIVTPAALSNLNLSGTVSNIIPQADPQTDTFEVWVSVDNAKGVLLPGMSAFARIQSTTKALSVPRLAVLYPNGDADVYVVRDQVAHLQSVQVIGRDVDNIYIGGGLQPNDQVVLVGMNDVQNGQRVQVTRVEGP
ncbi:MAG TPA: efflux RND transporter periplasmic adaptor subunit [Ktedonosporobacter sp.]|nr:efflux RND transporter periplasmic adaptor subunit [Ktedonosporobacter sp.]